MRRQSENESERAPSLRRRAVLWGAPVALLALAAGLFVRRPIAFRTSLDDLVGDGVEAIPAAVRAASADLVPVLVGPADDVAQAVAAARADGRACELERAGRAADGDGWSWRDVGRSAASSAPGNRGGCRRAHRLPRRAERRAVGGARGVPVCLGRRLRRTPAHGCHGGQLQAGDQCAQHFLVRLHRAPVGLRVPQRPLDSAPRRVARGRRARRGRRAPGAVLRDPPDDGRLRHDGDGPRD